MVRVMGQNEPACGRRDCCDHRTIGTIAPAELGCAGIGGRQPALPNSVIFSWRGIRIDIHFVCASRMQSYA